jgi:hypothetical protein
VVTSELMFKLLQTAENCRKVAAAGEDQVSAKVLRDIADQIEWTAEMLAAREKRQKK